MEKPANPSYKTGKTGTLLNVFTYPEYRRMGLATSVIKAIIDEAKKLDIASIDLAATDFGKPLYEKLGFTHNTKNTPMMMPLAQLPGEEVC